MQFCNLKVELFDSDVCFSTKSLRYFDAVD